MTDAASPRESLVEILRLERVRDGEFVAPLEDFWGASLGGDVLARAALAAAASCAGLELRSLHASFLRPVPPGLRLRAARRAARGAIRRRAPAGADRGRRPALSGDGELRAARRGLGYQDAAPAAGLPPPEELPSTLEQARAEGWSEYARGPIEFRRAHPRVWPDPTGDTSGGARRVDAPARAAARRSAPADGGARLPGGFLLALALRAAHRTRVRVWIASSPSITRCGCTGPLRWDDWWLLETISEVAHAGRGLSRRRIFTRDGGSSPRRPRPRSSRALDGAAARGWLRQSATLAARCALPVSGTRASASRFRLGTRLRRAPPALRLRLAARFACSAPSRGCSPTARRLSVLSSGGVETMVHDSRRQPPSSAMFANDSPTESITRTGSFGSSGPGR